MNKKRQWDILFHFLEIQSRVILNSFLINFYEGGPANEAADTTEMGKIIIKKIIKRINTEEDNREKDFMAPIKLLRYY